MHARHHAAEDELLWPSLHARIPTSGLQIQQMEDDHAAIAELVESVETVRTPWGKSADSTLAAQLIAATEQLSARVDTHLEDEEQNILPLIGQHITGDEWKGGRVSLNEAQNFSPRTRWRWYSSVSRSKISPPTSNGSFSQVSP